VYGSTGLQQLSGEECLVAFLEYKVQHSWCGAHSPAESCAASLRRPSSPEPADLPGETNLVLAASRGLAMKPAGSLGFSFTPREACEEAYLHLQRSR
jgi:hypothetical protein